MLVVEFALVKVITFLLMLALLIRLSLDNVAAEPNLPTFVYSILEEYVFPEFVYAPFQYVNVLIVGIIFSV